MSYLSKITKPTPQAACLTIIGFPGVGKSTLAALFPAPLFIQAENAQTVFESWAEDVQPSFFPMLPKPNKTSNIRTSEVLLDQLRELCTQEHDFQTLVIDTVTALNDLLTQEVVAFDPHGATDIGSAAGGFNKGFNVLAGLHAKIRSALEVCRKRGMTIVMLGHSGITKMKNRPDAGEYTAFTLDMPEASRAYYIHHADAVLYLKNKEYVSGLEKNNRGQVTRFGRITQTGERVLIASSDGVTGFVDAKNRYGMPVEIEVPMGENPVLQYIPFFNQDRG